MIRKTIVLLVVALACLQIAYAESSSLITGTVDDFSIRNNVKFLMSMEEVKTNETLKPEEGLYSQYKNSIQISGQMAGYDNVSAEYIFDDNLKLESFAYYLAGSMINPKSIDQIKQDFAYTDNALAEKYGESLKQNSGYYSDYLLKYADLQKDIPDSGILDFSERFIKVSTGGYVKIEHWTGYSVLAGMTLTDHYVQYTYFSDDMMKLILSDYASKQEQKSTDY